MEFLNNLEMLMSKHNMNRSELARACGLSTSTVNSWWNRGYENVSLQTLIKLSNCFDCTLEEIVNGTPECVFCYSSSEFSNDELKLIYQYSLFLKYLRKGGNNGL